MHKVIVKDNLIYEARAIDPDQALVIARANELLSAEAFCIRYNGRTLTLASNGQITRDQTDELQRRKLGLLPD